MTIYTDHSPITFLTETAPYSAKLMRWSLALQNYDVIFRYKAGKNNAAGNRMGLDGEPKLSQE